MIAVVVLLAGAGIYLGLLLSKAFLASVYARRYPAVNHRDFFPEVTVLQPILGGDPALADTLAANLGRLPGATFFWLIDEGDVDGWAAVRDALAKHPGAWVESMACAPAPATLNPKLFKLALVEDRITTPVVVVLDDDTRLTGNGLCALLDALTDHDLATGLPCYLPGPTLASRLVAQFVNNHGILTYLPALVFGPPITINGMAWAMRTERWRALGGVGPLCGHLADDLAVARWVLGAGGRIRQTIHPHETTTTVRSWGHYIRLMHRWFVFAVILLKQQPWSWRLSIAFLHGLPPIMLWVSLAAAVFCGVPGLAAWFALVVVRSFVLGWVQRRHFGRAAHSPLISLLSELVQPGHLAHAAVSRRIRWRSRLITVESDSSFLVHPSHTP